MKLNTVSVVTVLAVLALGAGGAQAAGERIAQSTAAASDLRNVMLPKISLPKGFKIELFALAPNARHLAVSPKGTVWIGTRSNRVWQAADKNGDQVADVVEQFAPQVNFKVSNGVCLSKDGSLYVAEHNRVMRFFDAESYMQIDAPKAEPLVKLGELTPRSEQSYGHNARVCKIGPDDKIYISLGQPYNVSPASKLALYKATGIGGIIRLNRFDGSEREVVAQGIRNSVGHDFNPKDGSLWFTDNQVDGMGDDIPPGELNKAPKMGMWYGFPYYGGGDTRTNEYRGQVIPKDDLDRYVAPQIETVAHAADLGMMFYTGKQFPKTYHNAIFSAQHGSWNRSTPIGARVMVTYLDDKGDAIKMEPFAEGWLNEAGRYLGRPVDVAQYIDGSLLVSDDKAGAVYRIYYSGQ